MYTIIFNILNPMQCANHTRSSEFYACRNEIQQQQKNVKASETQSNAIQYRPTK